MRLRSGSAGLTRRDFVHALAATSLAASIPEDTAVAHASSGTMLYRTLGRTGERVSALGLGGYHIGVPREEQDSLRLIRRAIDQGITFLDNCWDYHDGESERRMGKALRDGYRQQVLLMTKIDGRTKRRAAEQINDSLRRLQTAILILEIMTYQACGPPEGRAWSQAQAPRS